MRFGDFLRRFANLFLEADVSSADWVKVHALRQCWYSIFGIGLLMVAANVFMISASLDSSITAVRIFRWLMFSLGLAEALLIMTNAYIYYRYILSRKIPIHLQNVLFFYMANIIFFAIAYIYLYHLYPDLFVYDSSEVVQPTLMRLSWRTKIDFVLFSAFQTINGSYFRIHGNSAFVSVMLYIQSLFTITLIALLISSYVNQKTK